RAAPPRRVWGPARVFVPHAHFDPLIGLARLLRLLVGREKTISLYGPADFVAQVHHKLSAYRWNLVDRYECDLVFLVTEIDSSLARRTVRFRLKAGFAPEEIERATAPERVLHDEAGYRVCVAILEHRTPCLAFAIEEAAHVNVW